MAIELDELKKNGLESVPESVETPGLATAEKRVEASEMSAREVEIQSVDAQEALREAEAKAIPAEALTVVEAPPVVNDPQLKKIEKLLAEGLDDAFQELLQTGKAELFKQKGEEIALQFRAMIVTGRVDESEIFEYVSAWLGLLTNANTFYMNKEKKRKTDAIVRFVRESIAENQSSSL